MFFATVSIPVSIAVVFDMTVALSQMTPPLNHFFYRTRCIIYKKRLHLGSRAEQLTPRCSVNFELLRNRLHFGGNIKASLSVQVHQRLIESRVA